MAANILSNERAIHMSIFIVHAFIKMRQTITSCKVLSDKLDILGKRLSKRLDVYESIISYVHIELKKILELRQLSEPKWNQNGFK
jgi:hypothetical protein